MICSGHGHLCLTGCGNSAPEADVTSLISVQFCSAGAVAFRLSALQVAINASTQRDHVTRRCCACVLCSISGGARDCGILSGAEWPDWSRRVQVLSGAHAYLASSFERVGIKNNCQELPDRALPRPNIYPRPFTTDSADYPDWLPILPSAYPFLILSTF